MAKYLTAAPFQPRRVRHLAALAESGTSLMRDGHLPAKSKGHQMSRRTFEVDPMFQQTNPHLILDLHQARVSELRAEANRFRLGRSVARSRETWWQRVRGRHPAQATCAPVLQ